MSALQRIAASLTAGRRPLVILDVDLTLLDNAPRTRAIFADWCASQIGHWDGAHAALSKVWTMPVIFDARANVAALGVTDSALQTQALSYWWQHFFGHRHALLDAPLPGAVEAAQRLAEAGATVVYLTARPTTMAPVTTRRFRELGLPVAQVGTALVMKDDPKEADGRFKARALDWIAGLGSVVLCADNEPGHVNTMHARFPDALSVLVDTRHSPGAPPLDAGITRSPTLLDVL